MLEVPPEFRGKLVGTPKLPSVPEAVAALEAFASEIQNELRGTTPQLYQINRARLALADRHELLRRATPTRSRGRLDAAFNRAYAELFDLSVKLQVPELSPPPVTLPAPELPPRRRSTAEVLAAAFDDL